MKMKKKNVFLLISALFAIYVVVMMIVLHNSYYYVTPPNSRAMFGLYGPVKSLQKSDSRGYGMVLSFEYSGKFDEETRERYFYMTSFSGDYLTLTCELCEDTNVWINKYQFDKKGRLVSMTNLEGGYDVSDSDLDSDPITWVRSVETYEYAGRKEKLPNRVSYKEYKYDNHDEIYLEWESNIEYGEIDDYGNWLSCSVNGFTEKREISYYDNALADNCCVKRFWWDKFWQTLLITIIKFGIIFFLTLGVLAILGHMIREVFFRKKIPCGYTSEYFKGRRRANGLAPEATDEENSRAYDYTDKVYELWSPIGVENDIEYRVPLSKKVIKQSVKLLEQAIAENPTAPEVVERINACGEVINEMNKRSFAGSKTYIVISLLLGVILGWAENEWNMLSMIIPNCIIYILTCMKPEFMQMRAAIKGGGNRKFMSAIFGGLFTAVATAKTYEVVTTYSDGTKTSRTDNSETGIALVFAFIVMVMLSVLMMFVSLVNYIRNYLIYR